MPNTYFQFKQFIVRQDRCAMKVCTDSCMFGAWVSTKISGNQHVLDIGSGTGLLMLMLAQKNISKIEGVELDSAAFLQSGQNISESPCADSLHVFHGDIRSVALARTYDFIITNPPFYQDSLSSP